MDTSFLFEPIPTERLQAASKEDLIKYHKLQDEVIKTMHRMVNKLRKQYEDLEDKNLYLDEMFVSMKSTFYGKSSEKSPSEKSKKKQRAKSNKKKKPVKLPSERYPNIPLIEKDLTLKVLPTCKCCSSEMKDSGLTEDSERLTVEPKKYMVVREKRHIYTCGKCYSNMVTTPGQPTITPGGSYSDKMVVDVAMTKYCDLIPVQRYSAMAGRQGLADLPPQSLIQQTHHLADFVTLAYNKVKEEILKSKILHADETPHKMLEGSDKKNWYLWGFSNTTACYLEIKDTRSGDVASEILKDSQCEYLMTDIFSGYKKSVKKTNEHRKKEGLPKIQSIYCNAHARRKFKESLNNYSDEAEFFILNYKKIYRLNKMSKKYPKKTMRLRRLMEPIFRKMKLRVEQNIKLYSSKSTIAKAMLYFYNHYGEFTKFIEDEELPIDNNPQERLLRSPVVGRKTWYGTHSKRGAKTAAILFTLVESCKLNKVNPRTYFKNLVEDLHAGKTPYTPSDFKINNI